MKLLLVPALATLSLASFASCSTTNIQNRQQSLSNAHSTMISNREARQQARDQRMNASRESWMN